MKVYQSKCPKCGNNITYSSDNKELICESCKSHFPLSNGKVVVKKFISSKVYNESPIFSDEFGVSSNFLTKVYTTIVLAIFLYCLTLTLFAPEVVSLLKKIDNKKYDKMTDFSKLDMQSKKYIEDESMMSIRYDEDQGTDEVFHYGFYFLYSKEDETNKVYDIYRKVVYADDLVIISYVPVLYTNLKVKKDGYYQYEKKEYVRPQSSITNARGTTITYYGYNSLEELYNDVIKSQKEYYKIEATEGLYMES